MLFLYASRKRTRLIKDKGHSQGQVIHDSRAYVALSFFTVKLYSSKRWIRSLQMFEKDCTRARSNCTNKELVLTGICNVIKKKQRKDVGLVDYTTNRVYVSPGVNRFIISNSLSSICRYKQLCAMALRSPMANSE